MKNTLFGNVILPKFGHLNINAGDNRRAVTINNNDDVDDTYTLLFSPFISKNIVHNREI